MYTTRVLARSSRAITATSSCSCITANNLYKPINSIRPITCSTKLYKEDKRQPNLASRALEAHDDHEGSFGRTDNTIRITHPNEAEHPPSAPVQGRGGLHFKRTLASFTLEDRVAVVTGGARGLGLVMSQACVISGADVAIVDLNSKQASWGFQALLTIYRG
jgi:D-arabinitol 2-dehydrogenase